MKELFNSPIKYYLYFFLLCHVLSVFFATGYFHPDEHFQILEFAGYHLNITPFENLTWEFSSQMRPWLLPFTYVYFSKLFTFLGIENQTTIVTLFQLVLSALSFYSYVTFQKALCDKFKLKSNLFYILAFTLWFIPFMSPRILSETIGTSFFFLGLAYYLKTETNSKTNTFSSTLIGLCWGLGLNIRYHLGLFFLSLIKFNKRFMMITVVISAVTVICFVIDHWGYGLWTSPLINYFTENLINDQASRFGTSPWWNYFYDIQKKLIPPFSFIVIFALFHFWAKIKKAASLQKRLIILTLVFFVAHSLIAHKEIRFLYPLSFLLPYILYLFFESLVSKKPNLNKDFLNKGYIAVMSVLMLYSSLKEVHPSFKMHRYLLHEKPDIQTLYHFGRDNPYYLAEIPVSYYKYKNIDFIRTTRERININKGWYFVEYQSDVELLSQKCQPKYKQYNLNLQTKFAKRNWSLFHCD